MKFTNLNLMSQFQSIAGLVEQYQALEKEFKKSKFTVIEKTGYSDNAKKAPIVATLENLAKRHSKLFKCTWVDTFRIAKRSSEELTKPKKPQSKLESALMNFGT